MSSTLSSSSSDNIENIELTNANSIVDSSIKPKVAKESLPFKEHDVFSYTLSKMTSFLSHLAELKIEFVLIAFMFSYLMRQVSTVTMIMDKVCLVHLNFSKEDCENLPLDLDKKAQVEKLANNYILGQNLIQTLPACFIAAFVGAWSDKYGRKIPLTIALVGIILDGLGTTICAVFFTSRVEYVLVCAAFTGFSGGFISAMTIIYSYASDITTLGQRTVKYAILDVAVGLSYPLGQLAGGWLYKISGYVPVFLVSTGGHLFSLAWTAFVLVETKGLDSTESLSLKLKNLFSLLPVVEGVKATLKSRPNNGKKKMLLLILGMSVTVLSYSSASNINFLYVHHQYDWDNTKYSTVSSTFSIIGIFFMVVVIPILKYFKLGDATLGITGNVSLLAKNVTIGFSVHPELYYLAQALGLLVGLATIACRSSVSKVISKDDIGKVFSFITAAESLLQVITAAAVSQFFNASLSVFPGIVFLFAGVLLLIPIAVFVWLGRQPSVNYEDMSDSVLDDVGQEA